MSMRYPGGFIASTPVTANYPSGVWTQAQAIPYQAQNVWTRDQYWPYTTLLLQGNGTNGAQNNTFLDSSTNNFTITRNGNTTQGSFTPYEQDGYWSNYFDTSQYINAGANSAYALGSSDWTMEMFVYITAIPSAIDILGNWAGTALYTNSQFLWRINSNGTHTFHYFPTSTGGQTTVTTGAPSGSLSTNRWYHFVLTKSGTTLTPFQDGVAGSTATVSTSTLYGTATSTALNAGVNNGGGNTNNSGYVSNVRLTIGQVLYTSAFAQISSPLTTTSQGATAGNVKLLTCQSNRFKDNSTNAFAITVNGSPSVQAFQPFPGATTWSASVLGGSGYFDGTGDWLTIADNAALEPGNSNFTIECWIYPTATGSFLGVFTKRTSNSSYAPIQVLIDNGIMNLYASTSGTSWAVNTAASSSPQLNAWSHIAVVRNGTGSNNLVLYLNGVSVATGSVSNTALIDDSGSWAIGADSANGAGYFAGYIANFKSIIGTAVYTTAFTPPTSPVTGGALLMNFTNAGIFDAAAMNDLETVGNAQVSTSVVKYGTGSMAFDGTGDYLIAPYNPNLVLGSGDFTVEMWLYKNANVAYMCAAGTMDSSAPYNTKWQLFADSPAGTKIQWWSDASVVVSTSTLSTGVWYHVAVTRASGTTRIFINGVLEASASDTRNYSAANQVWVGQVPENIAARVWNGYIDDLRITKGVARYLTSFTPPPARMPGQ